MSVNLLDAKLREKQEILRKARESLAMLEGECKSREEQLVGIHNRLRTAEDQLRRKNELEAVERALTRANDEIKVLEMRTKRAQEELEAGRTRGGDKIREFEVLRRRFRQARGFGNLRRMLYRITEMLRLHGEDDALAVAALESREDLDCDHVRAASDLVAEIKAKVDELVELNPDPFNGRSADAQ